LNVDSREPSTWQPASGPQHPQRLQKINREKFKNREIKSKTLEYICEKYPNIELELFTMVDLPTGNEEEAVTDSKFFKKF